MEVSLDRMMPFLMKHYEIAESTEGSDMNKWVFEFLPQHDAYNAANSFQYVVKALRSDPDYVEKVLTEVLSVTPSESDLSLEVASIPHISRYCLNETPGNMPYTIYKTVALVSEELPEELPMKMTSTVSQKTQVSPTVLGDFAGGAWRTTPKKYNIAKTFQYEHKTKGITFSVVMVRQSPVEGAATMATSGVSGADITYSYTMAITKSSEKKGTGTGTGTGKESEKEKLTFISSVLENSIHMIQLLTQQSHPMSPSQQLAIATEYNALVKKVLEVSRWQRKDKKEQEKGENESATSAFHFLAPKPITLERMHMVEPGPESYGVQSILKGYAVTDKADGERMLMYVSKTGEAYMINNTFEVFNTGLHTKNKDIWESLMDGEFILASQRRDGVPKDLFAVFDVYFKGGKSVMSLPLIGTGTGTGGKATATATATATGNLVDRFTEMKALCSKDMWTSKSNTGAVELRCKEHIPGDGKEILDACNSLLHNANTTLLPYHIDGLIFTPRELSVFGYYPGIPVPITENAKWERVMKWKPSDQNTIDFLITEIPELYKDAVANKYYKQFKLFTGYNAAQWEPITPMEGMRLRYDNGYARERRHDSYTYKAKQFAPFSYNEPGAGVAHVCIGGAPSAGAVCVDGTPIVSNTIVEFAYDPNRKDLPISQRWIPLRVREDKTRIYQRNKTMSKTANDLSVATSIWRSIHNPVNREHITGTELIETSALPDSLEERLLGVDDVYYARDVPRQHLLSVHMLDFHNQGIKKTLYNKCQNRDALLELACGMAGDLPRWRDGGYRFVMGVDLSRDNITNPRDGAYARMLKQHSAIKQAQSRNRDTLDHNKPMDSVFVVGDCALPLITGEAAGNDDDSKLLLGVLYSKKPPRNAPPYATRYMTGRALSGFSMVSCMFAIHYFFRSEDKLDGFLSNVANNLRKGGIFITTFMDGESVDAMLQEDAAKKSGFVEGRKLQDKVPVWAIIKRYNEFAEEACWGKHVDVFLENTNQVIPEFLVHFKLLCKKALEHGLELSEDGMFGETFNALLAKINPKKPEYLDKSILALKDDPVQTRFSFVNRWAVFKKI